MKKCKECSIEVKKITAYGMCSKCYTKWRYAKIKSRVCIIEGCNSWQNNSTGYCGYHYTSYNVLGDPMARGMAGDYCKNGHYKQWQNRQDGRKVCGECKREWYREREKRPERKRQTKNTKLRQQYQITIDDFENMLVEQNGLCGICEEPLVKGRGTQVDHDHQCCPKQNQSCGKCIRQLLCPHCNSGLGYFNDDIKKLESAINYIQFWRERHGEPNVRPDMI